MRASRARRAVAEEVGADAIGAVEVVRGRAGGKVGDAALFVDGDFAPGVDAADVLPGVFRPGFVAEFAGVWDGVKSPDEFAGEDVVGAEVPGEVLGSFRRERSRGG